MTVLMNVVRAITLPILIAITLCQSAAAGSSDFSGVPIEVITTRPPLRFCSVYGLEQDCSIVAGVQRQVPSLSNRFVVAGSADGTKVYVGFGLRAVLNMRSGEIDAAAAIVNDIGKSIEAKLLKVEVFAPDARFTPATVLVNFDGTLPVGALLTFDRDVYTTLKTHPGTMQTEGAENEKAPGTASEPIHSE